MQPSIIDKLSHLSNDLIGDDVHIAYQWVGGRLSRIYLGTRQSGPTLQYDAPSDYSDVPNYEMAGKALPHPSQHYDGNDHVTMPDGAWTPIYSRGDYGRRYAYGGHWSGHCRSLHRSIASRCRPTVSKVSEIILTDDGLIEMPPGIDTSLTMTDIDCSKAWAIWYPTAMEAMDARLSRDEIVDASLPVKSRTHLIQTETDIVRDRINDTIIAYNL